MHGTTPAAPGAQPAARAAATAMTALLSPPPPPSEGGRGEEDRDAAEGEREEGVALLQATEAAAPSSERARAAASTAAETCEASGSSSSPSSSELRATEALSSQRDSNAARPNERSSVSVEGGRPGQRSCSLSAFVSPFLFLRAARRVAAEESSSLTLWERRGVGVGGWAGNQRERERVRARGSNAFLSPRTMTRKVFSSIFF